MTLKGLFAQRTTGFRLFFLLLLIFFFGSLMQAIGMIITSSVSDVSIEDIIKEEGVQAFTAGGRNILRLLQVLFVTGVFILAPGTFAYLTYPNVEKEVGLNERADWLLMLLVGVLILMAGYPVDGLVRVNESLLVNILPSESWQWVVDQQESMSRQMAMMLEWENGFEVAFSFLLIACLPALAEEFMFRGVIQKELIRGIGVIGGIIVTALLFALTHFQPVHFIGLFFFGLILGLLRFWSGNLWYSVLGHFINNASVFITVYRSDEPLLEALASRPSIDPVTYALSFAGMLFGLLLFRWLLSHKGLSRR